MSSQKAENGLVQLTSVHPFEETYEIIRNTLDANPKIGILAEVDHKSNAKRADLELPNTKLIIFGNPNLGTPLMLSSRTVAIDLPQKILVWEDSEGKVHVSYNHPEYLLERHGITDKDPIAEKIAGALAIITQKVAE